MPQPLIETSEISDSGRLRHDLRNRINQIIGYSEILIEEASEGDSPQISDLERILSAGRALLSLVDGASPDKRMGAQSASADAAAIRLTRPDLSEWDAVAVAEPEAASGSLLVVDDSPENRAVLSRRLEMQGHCCTVAASGAEGLELLRSQHFDVLLLDLMMPEMDGFSVLAAIKTDPALRNMPVIMISASDQIESVVRCIEMGAADYLTKPFNATLLRARVSACLREKRLRDREERLFNELQENYRRERRIADALQRSLIEEIPEDSFPGIRVSTLYEAAWSEAWVGGDLFDAFALPNGHVALVVADASGKGLSAAVRIAQVKYVLRAFAREYASSPGQIVRHLNDFLCSANPIDEGAPLSFIALTLVVMDPATGVCQFVCAGSEPPFILRAGGDAQTLGEHCLPLGIDNGIDYPSVTDRLSPGDMIVLCTDGITEARSGNDILGYDRMIDLAVSAIAARPGPLRQVGAAILEGARAFGEGTLRDDACLLLARRY